MKEVATQNQFSLSLQAELENTKAALPPDFNIQRFVQNSVALLNGNDTLIKFAQQYGTTQIKAGLLRGAYLGLDALNQEMYLVPYGQTLNFMASYKGMVKMAEKYSQRKIRSIYAKLVRDGDGFEEAIENGEPTVKFSPVPFSNAEIIGAFAVCNFADGGSLVETMSKAEIETCRKKSRASNSPAWSQFWGEMAKKTVLRRLCKQISIDMDSSAREMFNAGTEIETDPYEQSKKDIEEQSTATEFYIEEDS